MFTIYIHILEVCAMNIEGASIATIGNMGTCFSMPQIQRGVRELEKEGFLLRVRVSDGRVYQITEKAIEYCDTIIRKREMAENEKMVTEYAKELQKTLSNDTVEAIPGAWQELPLQMVVSGDYVFSVDEDGIPDHVYVGLANDDGSLPFDAIPGSINIMRIPNTPRLTVTEVFETMTSVMGTTCPYCERAYTHSMKRHDTHASLTLVHMCKDRSYNLDWSLLIRTEDVEDNFSDLIPF